LALLAWVALPAEAFETITFPSSDGLQITVDQYLVDDDPARPVIVLFHQSRWSRGEYRETAPRLNALGFNCLAVDQRSGDTINGVVNETKLRAVAAGLGTEWLDAIPDMESANAWARTHHPQAPVIGWGSSYSSALILKLAGEQRSLVEGILSFSPGEYFSPSNLIRTGAARLQVPVFVAWKQSEYDRYRAIYDAIVLAEKVLFVPETSGNHGSRALWSEFSDSEAYWVAVEEFLARWTPRPVLRISIGARTPAAEMVLRSESHAPHVIEASGDLVRWVPLGLLSHDTLLEENSSRTRQRFFRLREIEEERAGRADVVAVSVTGSAGAYTFSVGVASPDTGCAHFADWWEVLAEDGTLLSRRILAHSHIDEQPFTRAGEAVGIDSDQVVWVRAHMNDIGFGGQAFHGSVSAGFSAAQLPFEFAPWTASAPPLPEGCAF